MKVFTPLFYGAGPIALMVGLLISSIVAADPLDCDFANYVPTRGLKAEQKGDWLEVVWGGEAGQTLRAVFAIEGGKPIVRELAIKQPGRSWAVFAENVAPHFEVVSGRRRLSHQQTRPLRNLGVEITDAFVEKEKWNVFWDAPLNVPGVERRNFDMPRKPDEIRRAVSSFAATRCTVKTDGRRLEITFDGLSLGIFSGSLRYTVYEGTNLLRQEAVARTMEPSVAYIYHAGFDGLTIREGDRIAWRDVGGVSQTRNFGGARNDNPVALRASNRLAVLERTRGSIVYFPPPHKFFFAREIDLNLGYVYVEKTGEATFGIGVRQAEKEEMYRPYGFADALWEDSVRRSRNFAMGNFALYNAPPGTWQRMAVYFYLSLDGAEAARDAVLRFTHGDRFKPLAGYKVAVSHFHTHFAERLVDAGSLDFQPPWIPAFRGLGINIAMMSDFHGDGHPRDAGPLRLPELHTYFEASRRHSDREFLIMTGEEPSTNFGGHYTMVFPKPVYWTQVREEGQPFIEQHPDYGLIYHIGSADEELEMLRREGGVVWQAHPRTKGSTLYPETIKDTEAFQSEVFIGASYQSLPVDQSQARLSEERCFSTLDDMNNWSGLKIMLAEGDTYTKYPGDDIYSTLAVNYVQLDQVPAFDEDWSPIIDALREGRFFVTTGEVLIPHYEVLGAGNDRTVEARVEWTFPLEFVEVVWGNGKTVGRKVVSATDLPPFGEHTFRIPVATAGKKWVRFAVWDSAGNGAFTQPVHLR